MSPHKKYCRKYCKLFFCYICHYSGKWDNCRSCFPPQEIVCINPADGALVSLLQDGSQSEDGVTPGSKSPHLCSRSTQAVRLTSKQNDDLVPHFASLTTKTKCQPVQIKSRGLCLFFCLDHQFYFPKSQMQFNFSGVGAKIQAHLRS